VISYETLKLGPGYAPVAVPRRMDGTIVLACPGCGQPILVPDEDAGYGGEDAGEEDRRERHARQEALRPATWGDLEAEPCFCQARVLRLRWDPERGRSAWREEACGAPLHTWTHFRRLAGADLLRRYPRFFGLFVADEVHKAQGGGTDVGAAFGKAVRFCRRSVALTGTLFGGKSKSLFYILLPYTTFATLADLGYALPAYREEAVGVEMALPQRAQYDQVDSSLRSMVRRKPRLLATWLQTTLGRPDTAFREEEIVTRITVGRSGRHREVEEINLGILPPAVCPGLWQVDGDGRVALDSERDDSTLQRWLPKEQWLAGFCRAEVTAGRRVLVYVRLTGTRDVQDRLRDALGEAGLRAMVLRQEVSPRRRDRWVRKHLPDVLIANPRLVETGLNLVAYATVVFFEIDYSLYTVWQACRRVWRPGQVLPVRVVFVAYRNSMEERAVALVGEKIAAAQVLYGDEVGGAIVPEPEDDFLDELARAALQGRKINLEAIFARENEGAAGPQEAPAAEIPTSVVAVRRASPAEMEPIDPGAYRQGALL